MASIEERIVQMQFDNTSFERKMSTTLQSLEKLNTTLANAGQRNGLQNIASAARNISFGPLSASVDAVSAKFLALSTIAITALSNIVNRAVDAGIRIASAFTIDPIQQGFQEYETQIGSIQTILANTAREGTNLQQVNAALDELNEYSDKTIYNFSEMARNIGTFTAAGVDLETSVTSIQGIANLAAISGSNSQQAATAMYQMSQAISTGTVRLMDWNSVVNAGMGGEVFQRALFDTGVAMGTIADAPMGTTFDEWTAAGNSFRSSLEEGWLTADVLTTALSAFSGEATEAGLMELGFTQEMAQEMLKLGDIGVDAATKVRTFSQLMTTVKESLSSGWAQTFRLLFGDFEEATDLFTKISDSIGGFVGRNADARNALLQTWRDMGGRTKLLYAFGSGFKSLRIAMQPLKRAFRDVFPPMTANRLKDLTISFGRFMVAIRPGTQTIVNMGKIFNGLFSALKIGWTVLKEGTKFIAGLFKSLTGAGSGGFLKFLGKIGQGITDLRKSLVDGGGIAAFFAGLTESLQRPLEILHNLRVALLSAFAGLKFPAGVKEFIDSIGQAFNRLGGLGGGVDVGDIWTPLRNAVGAVGEILDGAWEAIKGFFSGLGDRISDVFGGDAFSGVLDTIDTGLLGGIAVLLAKFLGGGLSLDFGGGLFGNISQSFEELTGVLSAMQTNLKANALLKIAAAIGILAASLALMASIDPEKMSDALASMAIGFGQLLGAFAILNTMGVGPRAAATMNLIGTAMILMAGAVLVLTAAVKIFSTMEWEELAKGLVGVAGALGLLVGSAILLSRFGGSMIRASVGMVAMAASLAIMAGVVKLFAMMEWEEMARGFAGVAGALVLLVGSSVILSKFSGGLVRAGVGLMAIALSLGILAGVVKLFSMMNLEEMARGFGGVVVSLGLLVGAAVILSKFSGSILRVGLSLSLLAGSLLIMAAAVKIFSGMNWDELVRGLVGMSVALAALVGASVVMSKFGGGGAIAIAVMAGSMLVLADALEKIGGLSWGTLVKAFVGIGGAIAILAGAAILLAPAMVPIVALGAALLLIGGAVALAGVGMLALAKAFEILARLGGDAAAVLITALGKLAAALPDIMKNAAEAVLEFVRTVLESLPELIGLFGEVIEAILDVIVENVPNMGEAIRALITEILTTARELFPDIVATGFEMLLALLKGIRDNIGEIVTVVAEIITNFLDALTAKLPEIIDSAYNFFVALVKGVVEKLVDVGKDLLPIGEKMIQGLIDGITQAAPKIGEFLLSLPGLILGWIGDAAGWLLEKGGQLISGFYNGAVDWLTTTVIPWLQALPGNIINWIGSTLNTLLTRGRTLIQGMWNGITEKMTTVVIPWLKSLPGKIINWIGSTLSTLLNRGRTLIQGMWNGITEKMTTVVIPWLKSLPGKIINWIGSTLNTLKNRGLSLIQGMWNGISEKMRVVVIPWLKALPGNVVSWIGNVAETLLTKGKNFIIGLINGYVSKVNEDVIPFFTGLGGKIVSWVGDVAGALWNAGWSILNGFWQGMQDIWDDITGWVGGLKDKIVGLKGPPKEDAVALVDNGRLLMKGLQNGMQGEWRTIASWLQSIDPADTMKNDLGTKMSKIVAGMAEQLESMPEFHPTITPILDLSLVREGAAQLAGLLPSASYSQASRIASTAVLDRDAPMAQDVSVPREIKFEQNNYSPKALTTGEIYRNTRNQITMAKEEFAIP
jgi:tape measure domain-containing protein